MSFEDQAFERLISKWPKRYQAKATQYIRGLMKALAVGDGYIDSQVEASRDNLIAITATGKYLDQRASLYGVTRGNAGILDPQFQKIIPALGFSPKTISHVLLQIVDLIYGPFSTRANVTSQNAGPFNLTVGSELIIRVDDDVLTVTFESTDAASLAAATVEEIATAITNKTNGQIIGSVLLNARTSEEFLNLRTRTLGSQGFIQVIGGDSQSVFKFPEVRPVNSTIATWDITRFSGSDEMVYTVTAGPVPDIKAAGVSSGDIVTIQSDSGFLEENTGSFEVTFVGTSFFRVKNPNGTPEAGITQNALDDFTFYKPKLGNVLLSQRPAAVIEATPKELTILLPVTSPVVRRKLAGSHHFHQGIATVLSTTSNSIELSNDVNFSDSGAVKPLQSRKVARAVVSTVQSPDVVLINGQNFPTKGAFYAPSEKAFFFYNNRIDDELKNVSPTPPASLAGVTIEYVEHFSYSSKTGTTLNGVYPDPTGLEKQEVSLTGADIDPTWAGSFFFDPDAPYTASNLDTRISETIRQGTNKTLLLLDDVTNWANTGSFVLQFKTKYEEGPIRYLSKVGNTGLIIDPSHVFERDHLKGVGIRYLRQIGAITPKVDGSHLNVFTTSTSPARDLLATYLRLIAASGIRFRFVIREPGHKWEVLPNLHSSDPLAEDLISV